MVARGQNFKEIPLNIAGSSTFGRYPKISTERTINMLISDSWLTPYPGYQIALLANQLGNNTKGRACYYSVKFNCLILVLSNQVWRVVLTYDETNQIVIDYRAYQIGELQTSSGPVYIAENNKPQILFSDNTTLYLYDTAAETNFININAVTPLDFTPGYITFHDGYFIAAATNNIQYAPPANNTWVLSELNNGNIWTQTSSTVGLLSTKPDVTQAVARFPSKGNMILVMGKTVTETWYNTGGQLFPYTRTSQFNIDYGCVSPATVAYMDEIVVWLAANEKSGPIIMFTNGGMPEKITTDGMDYEFSQLQYPEDSQGFLFRQDGHLIYHINFYTDNISYFYDFNTKKFFNATDENMNYFIAADVAYYDNQYFFVSKNTGNLYAFDTIFTIYQDTLDNGVIVNNEIPRVRICKNIRSPTQDYFVANDVGFTIETGDTDYRQQNVGAKYFVTQDGKTLITQTAGYLLDTQANEDLITQGSGYYLESQRGRLLLTQDGVQLVTTQKDTGSLLDTQNSFDLLTQDGINLSDQQYGQEIKYYLKTQQLNPESSYNLIAQQPDIRYITPRVDMSISTDGGASFGNEWSYTLNAIGQRKNALRWWQLGIANDLVIQVKFHGLGRFVAVDGICNIRM